MRNLLVRIRFDRPALGNVKSEGGRFLMPRRDGSAGPVVFSPAWHAANLRFAARSLGVAAPPDLAWRPEVDGEVQRAAWYRRYVQGSARRHVLHEMFRDGQTVAFRCGAPEGADLALLSELLRTSGRYRGLSPWHPGEYGLFTLVELRPLAGA